MYLLLFPVALVRPKMNGLLIYYLYYFLLTSEGLTEIIFVYVFIRSVYFLQVLKPAGILGSWKLSVGKAHLPAYTQALFLVTSTTRLLRAIHLCMADPSSA